MRISRVALAALRAHVAASPDVEVCGLLCGTPDRVDAVLPTRNVAADPATAFEVDPVALVRATRAMRSGGPTLCGHYHSHPSGCAEPSATDLACAADDGRLWLILGGGRVRGWRVVGGDFVEIGLKLDDELLC